MDNRAEFPMASIPASSAFVIRFPTEPRFFFHSFEIIAKTAQNVNFFGRFIGVIFHEKSGEPGSFSGIGMGGPWREKKKAPMKMSRFVLKIWKYMVRFHKMKFFYPERQRKIGRKTGGLRWKSRKEVMLCET